MPDWGVAVLGIGLLVWAFGVGILVDDRLQRLALLASRNRPGRMLALVLALHVGLLLLWIVVGIACGIIYGQTRSYPSLGFAVVPMLLLSAPVTLCFLPAAQPGSGGRTAELRRLGASRGTARAMYLPGGAFAFLEMGIAFPMFFLCFLNG